MIKKKPLKVVFDTNVSVSALLWTGIPHELLKQVKLRRLKLFVTSEILYELENVLKREKFLKRIHHLKTTVEEIMIGFLDLVEIVKTKKSIKLKPNETPGDEDDIMFLLCAIGVNPPYLISGDPHLLRLKMVRGVRIITPQDFYEKRLLTVS